MIDKKIAGIICEYNPFHNGHAFQIAEIKRRGYDTVVAIMSGNTVQRGEFAILDKYTRARTALCGGADLVLELPYPYSASSTEFFATAGVRILSAVGADAICFGSETGDAEKLYSAARVCLSAEFEATYRDLCVSSLGTASAYFEAYRRITGEDMPSGSNDILGVAYLRAIISEGTRLEAEVIRRRGSAYRDENISAESAGVYPSALMIRNEMSKNGVVDKLKDFMPAGSFDAFRKGRVSRADELLERSVLSFFRLASPLELSSLRVSEAGGGLAEKLCKVSHKAHSLKEMKEMAMTGKYTLARVSRAVLHCMTGADESDVRRNPAYTTVLGFNSRGKELLGWLRKNSLIPIVTKPADAPMLGEDAARQYALSCKADALFTLCFDPPLDSSEYVTASPVIEK